VLDYSAVQHGAGDREDTYMDLSHVYPWAHRQRPVPRLSFMVVAHILTYALGMPAVTGAMRAAAVRPACGALLRRKADGCHRPNGSFAMES
jgi:hypothetical protein